ncbi:MAG: pyridoxal phosphate-dependent aminotransferase [Muribaculaceae bacterium]|nr:pyridoxal phosphate-dependent aminotransferase [Muribaculaceae bacterium]
MTFDFDTAVNRRNTNSYKWDSSEIESDVLPMWVADMDFKTAPCVIDALRARVEHGIFGYVTVPGAYYDAVTGWFKRRHGWNIDRDWIQYTSGVVPAISAILKGLTRPGDKVLVMTPVYNCFFSSIRNNGCTALECPLVYENNTYHIDYGMLEQCASRPDVNIMLLCNPHNPACRVWTVEELTRIGEICRDNNVIVVSDEIHCELVMDGYRYTPFASISPQMQDICITCNSPSKAFNTAGLQIANIITNNPEWRSRIDRAINDNEVCDVNPFGVEGLIAAYTQGEPWLKALCSYIQGNYQEVKTFFEQNLSQLPVTTLEGTYLVWIDCRSTGMTSDEITHLLHDKARVLVNSGTMYGDAGQGFIRLNIACPRSRVTQALSRMLPVLRTLI